MKQNQKLVFVLNGPARSGKDLVADILIDIMPERRVGIVKFAQPLRDAVTAVFGVNDEGIDDFKIRNLQKGNGRFTGRDFMIALSETIIKPHLGMEWFGLAAAKRIIASPADVFAISDCGFPDELRAHIVYRGENDSENEYAYIGWQISRPGHSFNGDSRNWVHFEKVFDSCAVPVIGVADSIHNSGTKDALRSSTVDAMIRSYDVAFFSKEED
jgi:hypothetical protein